ncbi:MAG: S16 family serine protease [Candidatus Micrarchaeota archaeon]
MDKGILLAILILSFAAIVFSLNTGNYFVGDKGEKSVSMMVPAVDAEGKGFLLKMDVEVRRGAGMLNIISEGDEITISGGTEDSFKTAVAAAARISGADFGKMDVTFVIHRKGYIAGSSAAASAVVGLVSLAQNRKIRKDALITGSLDENGKINRVGFILEKANAAKETGYEILLVPEGEAKVWVIPEGCRRDDGSSLPGCRPEKEEVDVMEATEIKIIEVSDLEEAAEFMLEG